jgi:hypothetical protein
MDQLELMDLARWAQKGGFTWVDGKASKGSGEEGRWLVVVDETMPPGFRGSAVQEKENPALYLTFCRLDLAEEAVKAFADRYGWLRPPVGVDMGGGRRSRGLSWEMWERDILEMRRTVELWLALEAGDFERLMELLKHEPPITLSFESVGADGAHVVYRQPEPPGGLSGSGIAEPTDAQGAMLATEIRIQAVINEHLRGSISPVLAACPPSGRPGIRFTSKSLLAGLWFQFLRSLTGKLSFRECPQCREWFAIRSDKANRLNRKFCSNKCRTAAYKARRQEAVWRVSEGEAPAAVAKALDMDAAVVRRWVKGGAAKRK